MHQQQYLMRPANTQENINIRLFMKFGLGVRVTLHDKLPTRGIRQMVGVKHTAAPAAYVLSSQREYTAGTE